MKQKWVLAVFGPIPPAPPPPLSICPPCDWTLAEVADHWSASAQPWSVLMPLLRSYQRSTLAPPFYGASVCEPLHKITRHATWKEISLPKTRRERRRGTITDVNLETNKSKHAGCQNKNNFFCWTGQKNSLHQNHTWGFNLLCVLIWYWFLTQAVIYVLDFLRKNNLNKCSILDNASLSMTFHRLENYAGKSVFSHFSWKCSFSGRAFIQQDTCLAGILFV